MNKRQKTWNARLFGPGGLLLLSLVSGVVSATPMQWIVFGDSLTDSGNLFSLTGGVAPPSPPYTGVFSNGPVWTEQLASQSGLTVHNVFPLDGGLAGTGHVENFAVGGSFTRPYVLASPPFPALSVSNTIDIDAIANGFAPGGLPGLSEQLDLFHSMTPLGAPADATYVVWAGANDLLFSDLLDLNGFPSAPTPAETLAPIAAANVQSVIVDLAASGAEQFLVANLPDIGLTPFAAATGRVAELSAASNTFNEVLGVLLGSLSLDISLVNVHAQFEDLLSDPLAFGFSELGPCIVPGVASLVCTNPDETVFWDPLHPTSATHALLAGRFATAAAPEPATIVLLSLGLGLLMARRVGRAQSFSSRLAA